MSEDIRASVIGEINISDGISVCIKFSGLGIGAIPSGLDSKVGYMVLQPQDLVWDYRIGREVMTYLEKQNQALSNFACSLPARRHYQAQPNVLSISMTLRRSPTPPGVLIGECHEGLRLGHGCDDLIGEVIDKAYEKVARAHGGVANF